MTEHYLSPFFNPGSIAIFGASEKPGSVGGVTLKNLSDGGYQGKLYPLNPRHDRVYGHIVYPSLKLVPGPVELAIIATPTDTVPDIIEECGRKGVKAVIIMSGGFNVQQPSDVSVIERLSGQYKLYEKRIFRQAKRYGMLLLGPNSLGLLHPRCNINASYSVGQAKPGRMALISQSGALITAILDWSQSNDVGFSHVISIGHGIDIDFGEALDYLITDPETDSILLYVESIHSARRFMSALRAAARVKPIIVMKAGIQGEAAQAVHIHTGVPIGDDEAFMAGLDRAGVVRVPHFANFFAVAKTLSSGVRTHGDRIAIISNSGSAGIIATDALQMNQLPVTPLPSLLYHKLNSILPSDWSKHNPIDIGAYARPATFTETARLCLESDSYDAALIILTPQAVAEPEATATVIAKLSKEYNKPIFTCWMGESLVHSSIKVLNQNNIPNYRTPEAAVEGFKLLANYQHNQKLLLQVPAPNSNSSLPRIEQASSILKQALQKRQYALNQGDAAALLGCFDIPCVTTHCVNSADEAVTAARKLGYPVALKLDAPDIKHKTDIGGVYLNLSSEAMVKQAYEAARLNANALAQGKTIHGIAIQPMHESPSGRELMVEMYTDPVFGPVIRFGTGGFDTEHLGDYAVSLPPLNQYLAQNMVTKTRANIRIDHYRNYPPANRRLLEEMLLNISSLICEMPNISSIQLNPVVLDENTITVLDARIHLKPQRQEQIPYHHMAIHPYPTGLIQTIQLRSGESLLVRPIRPEDAVLEQQFTRQLSQKSRYTRFMFSLKELTPRMLSRLTQIDYDREMALIALQTGEDGTETEVGTARYALNPDQISAEFAIVVADQWQNKGVASMLIRCLLKTARNRRIRFINGQVLHDNAAMLHLLKKLGFSIRESDTDRHVLEAKIDLYSRKYMANIN